MKTKETKLQFILEQITQVAPPILYGFEFYTKKAKKNLIEEYKNRIEELENITPQAIKAFDFAKQVYQRAERLEQRSLAQKLVSTKFIGLEVHKYAPELNTAKFKRAIELTKVPSINCNYTFDIKAPQVVNQRELINYLAQFCQTDLKRYLQS